ncbi:hypothetical protein [Streptomyces prasinopilosus]|uniref:hypothetical protein n=1 Tax=Streptomyces prasinopilosus TaxID=67344 RepID=UPI000A3F2EE6|nr:hypothetical protein [Streptomyces prasinopilosus]
MTDTGHHTHDSPTLQITVVRWPHASDDPSRVTLQPGDWILRGIVRAPAVPAGPDALRRVLEYALATLDHAEQGPDAHLDDPDA